MALVAVFAILLSIVPALLAHAEFDGIITLTDLRYGPKYLRLEWEAPPTSSPGMPGTPSNPNVSQSSGSWYSISLVRYPGSMTGTGGSVEYTTREYFIDESWSFNTRYQYRFEGTAYTWVWTPGDEETETPGGWSVESGPYIGPSTFVTVRKIDVAGQQTVDSRIDMRFSTYHFKDYKFKDTLYRGGLFAGNNNDGSRVSRTFFKFTGLTGPLSSYSSEQMWPVGGLRLYHTRSAVTGSTSLIVRAAENSTWDAATLVWSGMPGLRNAVGGSSNSSLTLSWDKDAPTSQWININSTAEIERALFEAGTGTANLSLVLLSPNETGSGQNITGTQLGWAYFARSTYAEPGQTEAGPGSGTSGLGSYLLYAFGGPGADGIGIQSISISPNYCSPYDTVTGTVTIASPAPSGGATVTLSCNAPDVSVPSSVTVPQGQTSATFTVDVSAVSWYSQGAVTGSYQSRTKSADIIVDGGI